MLQFWELLQHADLDQYTCLIIDETVIRFCGYVMYTLEAVLWCWINESSYHDIVLKAVNLGEDTDQ